MTSLPAKASMNIAPWFSKGLQASKTASTSAESQMHQFCDFVSVGRPAFSMPQTSQAICAGFASILRGFVVACTDLVRSKSVAYSLFPFFPIACVLMAFETRQRDSLHCGAANVAESLHFRQGPGEEYSATRHSAGCQALQKDHLLRARSRMASGAVMCFGICLEHQRFDLPFSGFS